MPSAPAVVTEKAALWLDASAASSITTVRDAWGADITKNSPVYPKNSQEYDYVQRWRDCRPGQDRFVTCTRAKSAKTFDEATIAGTLADVPYMIGYTLNDLGNMGQGIADFCRVRAEKGGQAWAYQFARPLPDDGSHPEVTERLKGAFHSSDLWFVFKSLKYCWRPWTQGDWDLAEKMITYWTNFAKYSDPNGPDGGEWTPCTKENPNFMVFKLDENDAESSAMMAPLQGESQAWANAGK